MAHPKEFAEEMCIRDRGALPAGGAGAQLRILIRELPLVACAMGRGVDAKTHLLVTGAMVGLSLIHIYQTDKTGLGIQSQQGLLQVGQHAVEQDLPEP